MTCWRHGVMSSFAPACFVLKQIVTHERALQKIPPPQRQQPRLNNMTSRPGLGWSLDLAGPFERDEGGCVYLAVAVCVHSKWVEAC